mmetsp:Transcript_46965/g.134030  ORF Transcript_46965/g.134030 Transcript_46965/m.134030 type:complete len:219 (+) Transcript_46965:1839-2495(+)
MPLVQVSVCRCTLKLCGTSWSASHQLGSPVGAARGAGLSARPAWKRWQAGHCLPPSRQAPVPSPGCRPQKYKVVSPWLPGLTSAPSSLTPVCCSHSTSSHWKYWTSRFRRKLFPWRNLPMIATIETSSSSLGRSLCRAWSRSSTRLRPCWSISTPSVLARSCLAKRPVPCSKNSTSTASARPSGRPTTRPSLPLRMLRLPLRLGTFVSWPSSFRSSRR